MLRQKIADILDNYFADEVMTKEILEAIDKFTEETICQIEGDAMGFTSGAFSMLDTKPVTQGEIRDWATLNGYALIKINSIAARLKVEKVARELWGDAEGDKYFLE